MADNILTSDDYLSSINEIINSLDWRLINHREVTENQIKDIINYVDNLIYKMAFPTDNLELIRGEGWDGNFVHSEFNNSINRFLEEFNWQLFAANLADENDIKNKTNLVISDVNEIICSLIIRN
jgi:phosphoglycerate-specific signal transduction histidine kinase